MVELNYRQLSAYLDGFKKDPGRPGPSRGDRPPQVVLIYGEEVLREAAVKNLLNSLVPAERYGFNYEPVEDAGGGVHTAIEKLNTFSLLAGPRVVGLSASRVFDSGADAGRILFSARQAHAASDMRRAAADLLRFMALANLSFEDLGRENRAENLGAAATEANADGPWLDEVVAHCRETGRTVPPPADSEGVLCRAIEKGFPAANCLLMTADTVDKRKKLFKMICECGVVVDCTVPTGDRKADRKIQATVLRQAMQTLLTASGKTIDDGAFDALHGMTGFNLRAFCGNVEKLVDFVGERPQITRQDVMAVLARTKADPVYALTGALAARNLEAALFYLGSLTGKGPAAMRPEQVLVALVNQVRRLLRVKEFTAAPGGRVWLPGCSYSHFTTVVLPVVQTFDARLAERLADWRQATAGSGDEGQGPSAKKRTAKRRAPQTDLMIVKNPKNPYPVYQLFLNADNYTREELLLAFERLAAADLRLKSSGEKKRLILEQAIAAICRRDP